MHLHTSFLAVGSLSKMDSAGDRLDEKDSRVSSLRERIFSSSIGDSNWSRNYGWQLLSFTSLILGIGFYFIFVNSPIKAVRLMPNVPKTYGTYARPIQIPPIPDDDTQKLAPENASEEKRTESAPQSEDNSPESEAGIEKDIAPL